MATQVNSAKLRIVLATDNYPPTRGGAESVAHNLAMGFRYAGHEVLVIAPGADSKNDSKGLEEGVMVVRIHAYASGASSGQRFVIGGRARIKQEIAEFKPDIIQTINVGDVSKWGIRAGKELGIPTIGGHHVMPANFLWLLKSKALIDAPALNSLVWRFIVSRLSKADVVIAPTQTAIDMLRAAGFKGTGYPISNGIDIVGNAPLKGKAADYRKQLGLPEKFTVLYLGRISAEKRLDVLLAAFVELITTIDAHLVLVGPSDDGGAFASLVKKAGIDDRLTVVGFVKEQQTKREYIAASDVFAMPSPAELQSIVTLEAMAAGKPVVAVNAGALPELAHDGENGYAFANADSHAMAAALAKLAADQSMISKFGAASIKIAETHDIRKMPQHYIETYHEIIDNYRKNKSSS